MATVIPVDEFVTDEWYPGFKPAYTHAPWYIDPVQTFSKEDEENFWFLDFHWPRGLTPMGLIWNEDGYNWASQLAAEQMPLPPGRGITCRLGGTHTYGSALPVNDPREIGQRAQRLEPQPAPVPAELRRDLGPRCGRRSTRAGTTSAAWTCPRCRLEDLRREPDPGPPVPQAGLRDPLPGDVPAAGQLRRLLRHVHRARPGPGADRQVPAGLRHQDHGNRPGAVAADHRGPRGRAGGRLRRARGRRHAGGAGRPGRRGQHLADRVRRLPPGLRLAHRGLLRHRAAELDRGPDPGPRDDQDVPAEGHRARLRGGQERGHRGARGGSRRGPLHAHPGGAAALRRRPGLLPGGELPLVAGRPQLLHRPAHLAADAVGLPGDRRPGRRRPPGRHALPVLAGDHGRLGRAPALHAGLRSLVEQRKQYFDYWLPAAAHAAQGASAPCRSRSTTRS